MAGGQQLLRTDRETARAPAAQAAAELMQAIERAIEGASVVVLSDYAKGVLGETVLRRVMDLARRQHKKVVVDPRGSDYAVYRGASAW